MSPSLRCWSLWWWPLVHLRSFRCRLLDGPHYTRPTYVVQVKSTQTTPKPLQTLAFIGVSQPCDGDTSIDHRDVGDSVLDTATSWLRQDATDATPQTRRKHDGHGTDTART